MERKYWEEFVRIGTQREREEGSFDLGPQVHKELSPSYYNDKQVVRTVKERLDWKLIIFNSLLFMIFYTPLVYLMMFRGNMEFGRYNEKLGYFIFSVVLSFMFLVGFLVLMWYLMRKTYILVDGGIIVIKGRRRRAYDGKEMISRAFFIFDIERMEKVVLLSSVGGLRKPFISSGDLYPSFTMLQYNLKLRPNSCRLPPYTYIDIITGKMAKESKKTYYDMDSRSFTIPRYVLRDFSGDLNLEFELP